jgi:hypothetical protein
VDERSDGLMNYLPKFRVAYDGQIKCHSSPVGELEITDLLPLNVKKARHD